MKAFSNNLDINWDFSNITAFLSTGFNDEQLELLCDENYVEKDKLYGQKTSPWLFWTTELYSFGKCYRDWLRWPSWLPIPVYGDHGADPEGELYEHEINNRAKYYFCFYSGRHSAILAQNTKKIPIRITHPWVTYRRSIGIEHSQHPSDCLVFVPHSVPGIIAKDLSSNLSKLLFDLERHFPADQIKLCIHMHDVRNGIHRNLRDFGLPIFTLGNSSSLLFVDRFYNLVRNFRAGASANSGSQLYYCVELGLDYFLLGEKATYVNQAHDQMPKGNIIPSDVRAQALKKDDFFFRSRHGNLTEAKKWVHQVLGHDQPATLTTSEIRKIFLEESVRLSPWVFQSVLKSIIRRLFLARLRRFFEKSLPWNPLSERKR
jgi:hypothetical protein